MAGVAALANDLTIFTTRTEADDAVANADDTLYFAHLKEPEWIDSAVVSSPFPRLFCTLASAPKPAQLQSIYMYQAESIALWPIFIV